MGLLSLFKSKETDAIQQAATGSASELADAVQQARLRARHRLIGAAVLVMIGVIIFPLLFETQSRPVAVDIPIDIPRKESAPALTMPERKPAPARSAAVDVVAPEALAEVVDEPIRDAQGVRVDSAVAGVPSQGAVPTSPAAASAVALAPSRVESPKVEAAKADAPKAEAPAPKVESSRAESSKPEPQKPDSSDEKMPRFVVQAGAFTEGSAARDVRAKVEKLGLKTFVQVAETSDGKRIRVRVGPFNSRDEAEKVLARVKASGIQAAVLTL